MSTHLTESPHTAIATRSMAMVPSLISAAGEEASKRYIEFFTAQIRNKGTRQAYSRAVNQFFEWCRRNGVAFEQIEPIVVAAYIETLAQQLSAPTTKLHLAAIRMLYDCLVTGQIVPFNPAASVRGPKHVVKKGKTPVLSAEEARQLIDGIELSTIGGLRDRALIGVMVFSFARVSATLGMDLGDYFQQGRRMWFRLHEKGGKHHEVPVHPVAEEYVNDYLLAAALEGKKTPLFRTLNPQGRLSDNRMHRTDCLRMIKRRARAVGLPDSICCHSWRATGITNYLQNGGSLEHAMQIAAHESARTTKLYDRTSDELSATEVLRIQI